MAAATLSGGPGQISCSTFHLHAGSLNAMKLRTLLATFASLSSFALLADAAPLAVGAPAPMISAVDQDGKTVNFKDVYAKGPTLVYFYPKADTGGCTKQGCAIRDAWSDLKAKNIQVLGVSIDPVEAQKKFADKNQFPFTLIADADGKVAAAFQVDMRGKVTSRQSFLIKDGKVAWNMLKATTDTHAKDVLAAYEGLKK
jgi:peroxiredoxin Q/BCP